MPTRCKSRRREIFPPPLYCSALLSLERSADHFPAASARSARRCRGLATPMTHYGSARLTPGLAGSDRPPAKGGSLHRILSV